MNAQQSRERVRAIALATLGLVGLAAWLLCDRPALTPPPIGPDAHAGSPSDSGVGSGPSGLSGPSGEGGPADTMPANASDPATPVPRERVESGVHGTFVDFAGEPLVGWSIELRRRDRQPRRAPWSPGVAASEHFAKHAETTCRTGPDGSFEFVDLTDDDYEVRPRDWPEAAVRLHVEAFVRSEVALRLPDGVVAVTGNLWRDGKVDVEHYVEYVLDGTVVVTRSADAGGMRCALQPGNYKLRVPASGDVSFSENVLNVPRGRPRFDWNFATGGVVLEVVVHAGPQRSGHLLGIDFHRGAERAGESGYFAAIAKVEETVSKLLPAGAWNVHVHSPTLCACADQSVVLTPGSGPVRVAFDVEAGTVVELQLRDEQGRTPVVAAELLPTLLAGGRELPCARVNNTYRGDGKVLGFEGVPFGPAELRLEDRDVDGCRQFLPFEPLPPVHLVVADGGDNTIALDVQRRAYVDVRGCTATGREDITACVSVFDGERRVRGRDEQFNQRWAAWLPPGSYRAVVDRNGVVAEQTFVVANADLSLRLRP